MELSLQEGAALRLERLVERERAAAAVNERILALEWLQRRRREKMAEIKEEASTLAEEHAVAVQRRRHAIQQLVEEVRWNEEQLSAAAAAHKMRVEGVFQSHQEVVRRMHQSYRLTAEDMQRQFERQVHHCHLYCSCWE